MKILAIIPARGGSKGIPKKNIRLMARKPLIYYSIQCAKQCELVDDVYVTTDSDEIAEVAREYGADIVNRNKELGADNVTLDPVIYDAVNRIEEERNIKYDYVITMQPTSPLLKTTTLNSAIQFIINNDYDSVISVVNKPHLSWKKENDSLVPCYEQRKNRQELPPNYLETGAFVISKRKSVEMNSRLGKKISVFEVDEDESIDIDSKNDWVIAESILKKKKIIFRVDGYSKLGMGHIYNCISMAYSMMEHEILLVLSSGKDEGIRKVKETNFKYKLIDSEQDFDEIITEFKPDIVVVDKLNTEAQYIRHLKSYVPRVVTIEDLGEGTKYADAVINALYTENDLKGDNIFSGWKYVCLRDEFQIKEPNSFSEKVKNVLIMFGGTDPSNYNKMLYDILLKVSHKYDNINFSFVVGLGYDIQKNGLVTDKNKRIYVYPNVKQVTKYMKKADIAITSQGRTIFELAAMGVPSIVISQNEREKLHSFANMEHGFINLGAYDEIDETMIEHTLNWLINTSIVRKSMYDLMLKYPLRDGNERVKHLVLGD